MSAAEVDKVDSVDRVEGGIDVAAALLFGTAVAACALRLGFGPIPASCFAIVCACSSFVALRAVHPEPRLHSIADFTQADLPEAPEELLLSDEDRLVASPAAATGELLLDDVLAELAPDSRVVRLFDRAAMPTPGELQARIDRHLDSRGQVPRPQPDASVALHDALADLRRSLR